MATEHFVGPIDIVVLSFDERADVGAGLAAVLQRVDQGIVEILDLELVGRDDAGAPVRRALADLRGVTGVDLAVFDGVDSAVLDEDDLAGIAAELTEGQVALALVYEDRSLAAAAGAFAQVGAVELFSGGVDIAELDRIIEGNPS